MRALQVTALTGPDAVQVQDIPEPDPGSAVLVDVAAAGISFPDLLLSRGLYQIKLEPPFTLGIEAAGTVRVAPEGSGLTVGQRVCGFGFSAAAEQYAVTPEWVFPLPEQFSFEQGAAFVLNYQTALFSLAHRGALGAGQTVVIHGAAGGVGTASIQVAKGLGARTIAVVSSDEKEAIARQAGADEVIRPDDGWHKQVRALTEGRGADVVLDPVGGDRVNDSIRSLAEEGRLVVVGFTAGDIPSVALNRLLLKNVSVVGSAWGSFVGTRPEFGQQLHRDLLAMVETGVVDPIIGSSHALEDGADALRELDERRATGKVVVRVS